MYHGFGACAALRSRPGRDGEGPILCRCGTLGGCTIEASSNVRLARAAVADRSSLAWLGGASVP